MSRLLSISVIAITAILITACGGSSTGPDTDDSDNKNNEPETYSVSVDMTPTYAGTVSPSQESTHEEGEEIELSANPSDAYVFAGWTGDLEGSENPLSLTVDQDYELTANFELKTYELTVNTEGEGTVSETVVQEKSQEYEHGTVVELAATPAEGWRFVEWQGDVSGTDNPARITVDNPSEVTAVFAKKSYPLTIETDGEGVVSEQEIAQKTNEYDHGTMVELVATPTEGSRFVEWRGHLTGSDNPEQITVDSPKEVTAVFEKKSYPLTIMTDGQGAVSETVIQQKTTDYDHGTVVELEANPSTGWEFTGWQGDLTGSQTPVQITVTESSTITAVFELIAEADRPAFYLAENGVTIMCPDAAVGESGTVDGVTYTKRTNIDITTANAATTCTSGITDMMNLFEGAGTFNEDISHWDVSSVTDMGGMFDGATNFNADISSWDVSSVTGFRFMFRNASSFNQDIGGWDVSNATRMTYMFAGADSFNADISGWNVGNVTEMVFMFYKNSSFNQDIGDWDVSSVTDLGGMFRQADSFNADISGWDVSNVTNMRSVFSSASSFNQDISGWDVSNVTEMKNMFYFASSFNRDLSGWCVTNISYEPNNFSDYASLTEANKPVWGTCPTP